MIELNKYLRSIAFILCQLVCLFLFHTSLTSQVADVKFGKNRVQYHDDFSAYWTYDTDHFRTHWYGKGKNIAQTVIKMAEMDVVEIQNMLEHRIHDQIKLIVYTDLSDLKQSNFGAEDVFTLRDDHTKVVGDKVLVYFNGDHQELRRQIREGVTQIFINSMLYGANLQEILQNAISFHLPEWFTKGLVNYMGEPWNSSTETLMHQSIAGDKPIHSFKELNRKNPSLAGHSMWYFISKTYGKSSIASLLYLTKINRDLETAIFYVFGTELKQLSEEWLSYYQNLYLQKDGYFESINSLNEIQLSRKKKKFPITQIIAHPTQDRILFVTNDRGCYKIYDKKVKGKNATLIFKGGSRNEVQIPDYNYPKICWNEKGDEIVILYESKDVLKLWIKNLETNEIHQQKIRPEIQRVYHMNFAADGQLLLTVNKQGYSDMIFYKIKSREIIPIIDDFYDDLDGQYIEKGSSKGILFSSNRIDTKYVKRLRMDSILPINNLDIFYLDLTSEPYRIFQLTNTPEYNERLPKLDDDLTLYFIKDMLNTKNVHSIPFDLDKAPSSNSEWITNYKENINTYDINADKQIILNATTLIKNKYQYKLFAQDPNIKPQIKLQIDSLDTSIKDSKNTNDTIILPYNELDFFQSEFELPVDFTLDNKGNSISLDDLIQLTSVKSSRKKPKIIEFKSAKAYAYRKHFSLFDASTSYDNSLLVDGLVAYDDPKGGYDRPPGGILFKAQLKELFEDYDIITGMRLSTNFRRAEYFVKYLDNKKLLDKEWMLYRYSRKYSQVASNLETHFFRSRTLIGQYKIKYPFDIYRSIRARASFRQEKKYWLTSDFLTLQEDDIDEQRFGIKLEYVFDNTLYMATNMLRGTRYKASFEAIKKFRIDSDPWAFNFNKGFMFVADIDYRHYIKIMKNTILAFRFGGATSFGSEKILYYLGGTDNWILSQFDFDVPRPDPETFAYQAGAPNLRGFAYNARNGQSYALINTELRIAPINLITNRRLKWSLLRDLQAIGFVDIGMAWFGVGPRSKQNLINNKTVSNSSVTANVLFYKEPLLASYGWGLRTKLFGYFIRFDYGYGIDSQLKQKPIAHFSLGMDF